MSASADLGAAGVFNHVTSDPGFAAMIGIRDVAVANLTSAKVDEVRGSGWFVGHFVPPELGLRHQTDVELKWGIHRDGDKRSHPWASSGTTITPRIRQPKKTPRRM